MAAAAAILTNPPVEVRSHPSDQVSSGPAPSDGQLFSLRWHDFQSSILSSFRHLRDSEDFVDVTLACDGGRYFTAHKMVLSACSPYFRHLLKVSFRPYNIFLFCIRPNCDVRVFFKLCVDFHLILVSKLRFKSIRRF